jgi:hypothetical protein
MELWAKLRRWLLGKRKQPELCTQAKQKGVVMPPKDFLSIRNSACLNAKRFVEGMEEKTQKV